MSLDAVEAIARVHVSGAQGAVFVQNIVQISPVNQEESRLEHRNVLNRKESPRMRLGTRGANIAGPLILPPSRPKRDRVLRPE